MLKRRKLSLPLLVDGDPRARRVSREHQESALNALRDDGAERAQVLARRGVVVGVSDDAGRRRRRHRKSSSLWFCLSFSPCARVRLAVPLVDVEGGPASPCLAKSSEREREKKTEREREKKTERDGGAREKGEK